MVYNQLVLVANAAQAALNQKAPKEGGYAYEKARYLVYNQNCRYYGSIAPRHEWTRRLNPSPVVSGYN